MIAARKRQYRGDDEKVATTSIKLLIVAGIEISSRYDKANELELMRRIVLALPLACGVKSMFCDSKAGHCFSVVLRRWDEQMARAIASDMEHAVMLYAGGHNGIWIDAERSVAAAQMIYLDANWSDL
jgi:hypothetical protein